MATEVSSHWLIYPAPETDTAAPPVYVFNDSLFKKLFVQTWSQPDVTDLVITIGVLSIPINSSIITIKMPGCKHTLRSKQIVSDGMLHNLCDNL